MIRRTNGFRTHTCKAGETATFFFFFFFFLTRKTIQSKHLCQHLNDIAPDHPGHPVYASLALISRSQALRGILRAKIQDTSRSSWARALDVRKKLFCIAAVGISGASHIYVFENFPQIHPFNTCDSQGHSLNLISTPRNFVKKNSTYDNFCNKNS